VRRIELRPPSYYALAALIDGPLHGYGIVRRAAELSDGSVRLSTGTLYGLLERAIAEALVTAGEPYIEQGRQRRDYTLTPAGRIALDAEAKRLARAARTVDRRLRATARAISA
jgi:PadR family transcriptional regulator PadR